MSKAKRDGDFFLVTRMLRESLIWFRDARKHPDNADKDPYELARECANGAFKNHVVSIPIERREIVARKFMEACQKEFGVEVPRTLAESIEIELVS